MSKPLVIAGTEIPLGARRRIDIPVAKLFDYTELSMPVEVIRGHEPGPVLFVCAAIHGDEINGVEIIKRLLGRQKALAKLRGTLIAVPVVNVFGFNRAIRYLPDRRDLNRCFPGSAGGSVGAQIAHVFMREIVSHCSHGIDLHTGSFHRTNLPQIRACLDDADTRALAEAFGVPVILNSSLRDGSLRQAVAEQGIPMLLFEGGEALRYDEKVIRIGLNGVLTVMQHIGMLPQSSERKSLQSPAVFSARSSHWLRAPHSGSLRVKKQLGQRVEAGELLGVISDPFGSGRVEVYAKATGIIIGMALLPLVSKGDALFHIATFANTDMVEEHLEYFDELF